MTSEAIRFQIVTKEYISAYSPVTSDGRLANSNNPSKSYGKIIGISEAAIAPPGNNIYVYASGELINPNWNWPTNALIYLNGQSLSLSPPASGFTQILGLTKNSNTILLYLGEPILL